MLFRSPLFTGIEQAMTNAALCEPWTAYQALRLGLITEAVPVLRVDGSVLPNPLVVSDRWVENGRLVFGQPLEGAAKEAGKALLSRGTIDLSPLDEAVDRLVTKFLLTFPDCTRKTLQSLRKHKLEHWDRNRESNRAWLGLNMMTEGRAGFRAFHEGTKACREPDFLLLRQRLAEGASWSEELVEEVLWKAHGKETPVR